MEEEQINNEMKNLVEQARNKFTELEDQYNKFSELRTELQNKAKGIRNFYSNAESKSSSIDSLLGNAQNKNQELEMTKNKINEIKQEIDTYYQGFTGLREKLNDESDGVEANFDWVKEKRDAVNKKYEEVIKIHTNSDNLKKQIEEYKSEIEDIKQKSEEFKESIGETLNLVTSSSLTDAFAGRKDKISTARAWWLVGLIVSISLLTGAVLYIYTLQSYAQDGFKDWHSWYRYLFTSPLIYLVYVCSHYYGMERDYEERYAFKAVLSTSLESYIKLFRDKFPNEEKPLLDLTLETISTIYEKPYFRKDKRAKVNFAFKIINAGIEYGEKTSQDKEAEKNIEN